MKTGDPLPPASSSWNPARQADVYLQREFTIKELSENFTAKQAGQELPHKVLGTVTAQDDRDNGSTDRWDLVLTGCPVEMVPDRDGLWSIAPWHLTEGSGLRTLDYSLLPPRQRIHWASVGRAHIEKLPYGSEIKLGVWVSNTRARRDKLTQERLAALRELDMDWAAQ